MAHQLAVTVFAEVKLGEVESAREVLERLGRKRSGEPFGFDKLAMFHFARFLLVDGGTDLEGQPLPARVGFLADIDAPLDAFLHDLVEAGSGPIDEVFEHCIDYPARGERSANSRTEFLRAHMVEAATTYVNTTGRSIDQVHREAELREAIQEFLDRPENDWSEMSAHEARLRICDYVASQAGLRWALRAPPRPSLSWRIRETLHLLAIPALLLVLAPLILLALPFYLVALRFHELRDKPSAAKPSPEHRQALSESEDVDAVQNPFTVVGFVKPGGFRRWTLVTVLWLANYAARHVFNNGNLAGVKTIHFARWVFLDDRRRMIFASNYDGSLEAYMDDFIDKEAWALNAVFSNGYGYPRTSWLLRGGARNELAFKDLLRVNQIATQVWYSAVPSLTALNIGNNARIREGLRGTMTEGEASEWLGRL